MLGASYDTVDANRAFAEKFQFPFRLLCDTDRVLGTAKGWDDLGIRFGADLTEAEVRYLTRHEWAENADDVLWRRSKLGLTFSEAEKETLGRFMAAGQGQAPAA